MSSEFEITCTRLNVVGKKSVGYAYVNFHFFLNKSMRPTRYFSAINAHSIVHTVLIFIFDDFFYSSEANELFNENYTFFSLCKYEI